MIASRAATNSHVTDERHACCWMNRPDPCTPRSKSQWKPGQWYRDDTGSWAGENSWEALWDHSYNKSRFLESSEAWTGGNLGKDLPNLFRQLDSLRRFCRNLVRPSSFECRSQCCRNSKWMCRLFAMSWWRSTMGCGLAGMLEEVCWWAWAWGGKCWTGVLMSCCSFHSPSLRWHCL